MKVLMPMAGRGSRFKEKGYKEPKPLIKILGKPMVVWATSCIPYKPEDYIFIILAEHAAKHQLDKKLREIYGDKIKIVVSDGVTEGAAKTALLAKNMINNDEPLIVYNTDQFFKCDIEKAVAAAQADGVTGLIPIFHATDPKWSFAKSDATGFVTEVAEKVPISSNATAGLYYFSRGKDFVWATEQMISKDIRRNDQFYVCPVYNELLSRGEKIKIVKTEFMWGLGTPEDVEHFIKHYKGDIQDVRTSH